MTTRFADHLPGGDHGSRPAATTVPDGTLYSCTDHNLIYQSDGAAWSTWATLGTSGGSTGDADWTAPTFVNGWVNFGAGYGDAGYRKDGQGIVHLQGVVKSGTVGSNIFVLPVGYRPPADVLTDVDAGTRPGNIIVRSTGEVVNNNGGNVYFSLYGVYFFV